MPHPNFFLFFPLSGALGLEPVEATPGNEVPGFDSEIVKAKLGAVRYAKLAAELKEMFCCAHRVHPNDHPEERLRGTEVHCIWAKDLESFLEQEGK